MDELEQQRQEQMDMRRSNQEESQQIQDFLDIIRQIESSGGKDTDHPVMQEGIHAGQAAMGQYGLMPNTVQELARRFDRPKLAQAPVDQIPELVKAKPELEQDLAERLAELVLRRQQDPEKAAYSWNMGHNLTPEEIDTRDYQSHPYVQKFKRIKDMFTRKIAGE